MEYTFDTYDEILDSLHRNDYTTATFLEDPVDGTLLLRHDIDFSLTNAVRIAEMEAEYGFSATFFVGLSGPFYDLTNLNAREALSTISDLGHDVGLHFNPHQYFDSKPDSEQLRARISEDKAALSGLSGDISEAISIHAPPEWVIDTQIEGVVSTYEPRFLSDITYRSDSDQRWNAMPAFLNDAPEQLQLLTHPGLWNQTHTDYSQVLGNNHDKRITAHRKQVQSEYGLTLSDYSTCDRQ